MNTNPTMNTMKILITKVSPLQIYSYNFFIIHSFISRTKKVLNQFYMTKTLPTNDGNGLSVRVRKPVWLEADGYVPARRSACLRRSGFAQPGVSVRRRELFKTNNITRRRNGYLNRCRQTRLVFKQSVSRMWCV
jgi:hypothetical protein